MAGVPCVNDTCSITSTVDANGRLVLDVNLDPSGGIVCNDGAGLAIASPASHFVFTANEDSRQSMATANSPVDYNITITNSTGNTLLAVIAAKFDLRFNYNADDPENFASAGNPTLAEINNIINDRYYSFDLTHNILVNGGSVLPGGAGVVNTLAGIGPPNSAGSDDRANAISASTVVTLATGLSSLTLRSTRSAAGSTSEGTLTFSGTNYGVLRSAKIALLRSASSSSDITVV